MASKLTACGLMSGTSRDGVDVAIVRVGGRFPSNKINLIHAETFRYPGWLRKLLMTPRESLTAEDVTSLDFLLGEIFAECALMGIENAGLTPDRIDVIGSHGQTLLHLPQGKTLGGMTVRSTLQVGSGPVIAQKTKITTVSDFRSADIAVGGEGAPLVPVFDYVTLRSTKKSRIALNIGGISNLTAIPKKAKVAGIVAFDTGPGNCLIDAAIRMETDGEVDFDRNGALARLGSVDAECVETVLAHPYFERKPPKTTGWEEFGEEYTRGMVHAMAGRGRSLKDIVRTLTEATSKSIAKAIAEFVVPLMEPDEIIVTGGGSRNSMLMGSLRKELPGMAVDPGEACGIDSDAKEAMAFAYLAYLCLNHIAANIISQAAGLDPAVLGSISEV